MVFSYTITHGYLSGLGIANKNCEAGNISMVEFEAAKIDAGLPIFNYAVGYDLTNSEHLMYEKYPGSINDVSQLQFMVEKVKGYGYKNIGFILDRGYFSKENLRFMDNNGFIIMVKGCKEFISEQVRKQKGTFENDWENQIAEFGVYGKTVHTFVYTADTKKRYVHISICITIKIQATLYTECQSYK